MRKISGMSPRRFAVGFVVAFALLASGGCNSPGQMAKGLVGVPFDVARHVVVETVKVPIEAAGIGAKGVANAIFK